MGEKKTKPVTQADVGRLIDFAQKFCKLANDCKEIVAKCPKGRESDLAIAGIDTVLHWAGLAFTSLTTQKGKLESVLGKIEASEMKARIKASREQQASDFRSVSDGIEMQVAKRKKRKT